LEQFIYAVSHDLRSPLVTVKTFLGFLQHDLSNDRRDLVEKDLGYIHSAAERMEAMLNDLLEISRVGRTVAYNEEMAYRELVADSLAALAGQISLNSVDVQVNDADITLCGDRGRLTQIWQNLLENAVKYMGEQPAPRVELGVEMCHGELAFFVRDNGVGIHPDYQERIFGIFEQLDRKQGGVGMGLTMVRRIVELYGGGIRVESEGEGCGSRFIFTLPGAVKSYETDDGVLREEAQLRLPDL
jgi:signal transduction histidine kinase